MKTNNDPSPPAFTSEMRIFIKFPFYLNLDKIQINMIDLNYENNNQNLQSQIEYS